jgi:thiosulfate/3-mercaptopyruvate sulfurtransferase
MICTIPRLMEPQELESLLDDERLIIIDLSSLSLYSLQHVPGAVHLPYRALMSNNPPAMGKCPSFSEVESLINYLGIDNTKHVIVYDDEGGGWAGRFTWIMDLVGIHNWSYLNGGIVAWIKEGFPTESSPNLPNAGKTCLGDDFAYPAASISVDEIIASLGANDFAIWDARNPAEYSGEIVSAARGGHIPGAINLEWSALMNTQANLRIHNEAQAILDSVGLTKDKRIATHCQQHHRSGFTYMVARILGYDKIAGYGGSWAEWGNLDHTPVEYGL